MLLLYYSTLSLTKETIVQALDSGICHPEIEK
jgi:hypothetical protein